MFYCFWQAAFITWVGRIQGIESSKVSIRIMKTLKNKLTECMDTIICMIKWIPRKENEKAFDFREGKITISPENILYMKAICIS